MRALSKQDRDFSSFRERQCVWKQLNCSYAVPPLCARWPHANCTRARRIAGPHKRDTQHDINAIHLDALKELGYTGMEARPPLHQDSHFAAAGGGSIRYAGSLATPNTRPGSRQGVPEQREELCGESAFRGRGRSRSRLLASSGGHREENTHVRPCGANMAHPLGSTQEPFGCYARPAGFRHGKWTRNPGHPPNESAGV